MNYYTLIEKFNKMVEEYESKLENPVRRIILMSAPFEMTNTITDEAFHDPEIRKIYNEIMKIKNQQDDIKQQHEEEEIQKLVELGIDEVNRLIEEHIVDYQYLPDGPGFSELAKIPVFDDATMMVRLLRAKEICLKQNKKSM